MREDDYKMDTPDETPPENGGGARSQGGFSLEDILAEYRQTVPERPGENESRSERSRRIVMQALDQTINEVGFSSTERRAGQRMSGDAGAVEKHTPDRTKEEPGPDNEVRATESGGAEEQQPRLIYDGREYTIRNLVDADEREEYAAKDYPEAELPDDGNGNAGGPEAGRHESTKERFLSPVVAMLALIALRRGQRRSAEQQSPTVEVEDENVPEMPPERASKLYSTQGGALKLRARLASAVSLVMVYITFAWDSILPLLGALGNSMRAVSITLLIMELTVMVIGLDVLTCGVMAAVRARPGLDSLVAVACLFTLLDAAATAAMNVEDWGLPFCAVSASSLTFSIWGSYFTCRGYRSSFRLLAKSKKLLPMAGVNTPGGAALLRYEGDMRGFITRGEEADLSEYVYSVLAPMLFAMAVVLGLLAEVGNGQPKAALHCVSALMSVGCTFSGALCFALPFATAARRMFHSGCAVAGWSGAREVGRSRSVIITDGDLFPPGTVEIAGIRILEGTFNARVISYTGSVIAASGSGLAQCFSELIRKNGYSINKVENFAPHDGGGMTAMVNGESVYVGNTGFMNLMGIRVPQKLSTKSSVFTAINGSLVGIFTLNYKPVAAVQRALATLLRSKCRPVFAMRDFNITPMMIKRKFRMPTDRLEFPSYTERFELSALKPDAGVKPAAVSLRENMTSLVELSDTGRRLYAVSRAGAGISAVGSVLGIVLTFLLFWTGAFENASAPNALVFMLLWLLPALLMSLGLQN